MTWKPTLAVCAALVLGTTGHLLLEPEVERSPTSAPSGLPLRAIQAVSEDLYIALQTLIVQARLGPFDAQLR